MSRSTPIGPTPGGATSTPADSAPTGGQTTENRGSKVSARWRIVGWMVLTTGIVLLAIVASMRSILLGQVAQAANEGIVQEVEEFQTFVGEGVDPTTAEPFTSETELLERYLSRQTPATDEAFIAVTDERIMFLDNAAHDAGELLAQDNAEIERLMTSPAASGVDDTEYGTMRWGRAETEGGSALLVLQFTDPAREQVNQQTFILVAVAAGGLVLTAAIAWFVAGQILLPVRRISELATAIDDQDLSARIPVDGRDDIARAAHSVNGMLDRLEYAYGRQRHFVAEARVHLNRPLDQSLRALDGVTGQGPSNARTSLLDMRRTLGDLALLADAQTPGFLHRKEISVPAMMVHVLQESTRMSPQHNWILNTVPETSAHLDREAVQAALLQLARNAADHTATAETITLSGTVLDPEDTGMYAGAVVPESAEASALSGPVLRVAVANQGQPLAPEAARAMIEDYRSAAQEEIDQDRVLGMGLGLAVARSVADAHHGSLWVTSDPSGITTVGLDLPLAPEHTAASTSEQHQAQVAEAMEADR
ncbi:HAMP domain-containing protein [Kocuria sp.]|uniref:HAMP domain-containing protein n=1 Tax=Kocuria sp. TaxID=1871328 RepID=UPI0026DFAFBB|nr:HAMP domain-containing protein [Kocuria sp.]MDO5618912.1 HAMP domain-containing protein [Kocuria sp.]